MSGRWRSADHDNTDPTSMNTRARQAAQPARSRLGSDEVVDVEVREIPTERPPR
jgi:hypothetical protein